MKKNLKLVAGIIIFNGDFLLRQVLESIYPHVDAICIAEGPVTWWQQQGFTTSTDDTNKILNEFPDPDNKIKIVHGQYTEKDDQCRAWFELVPTDTDYILCVDADEVHRQEYLVRLKEYLIEHEPTSVGFKSDSFYGGFERIVGGFEREHTFKRVLKYVNGCSYKTHRQPTLAINGADIVGKDISGQELFEETGITMWHGSYLSPLAVYNKIQYYEAAVIDKGRCIPNYFEDVWLAWVTGDDKQRLAIEEKWNGVQEFVPEARGECKTIPYEDEHPDVIIRDMDELRAKFEKELKDVCLIKQIAGRIVRNESVSVEEYFPSQPTETLLPHIEKPHVTGNLVISRDYFIEIMEALKLQHEHDTKCLDAFEIILPDSRVSYYDNSKLNNALLGILQKAFSDENDHSWIEYFMYELNYGAKYEEGCVTSNDKVVPMSDAGELYDFLVTPVTN